MLPQENTNIEPNKKRYGWTLIMILGLGLIIVSEILWLDPLVAANILIPGAFLPVAIPVFLFVFLIGAILLGSTKRALIWSALGICWLYMRVYDLGTIINGLLLLGMGISWEIYSKKQ